MVTVSDIEIPFIPVLRVKRSEVGTNLMAFYKHDCHLGNSALREWQQNVAKLSTALSFDKFSCHLTDFLHGR